MWAYHYDRNSYIVNLNAIASQLFKWLSKCTDANNVFKAPIRSKTYYKSTNLIRIYVKYNRDKECADILQAKKG